MKTLIALLFALSLSALDAKDNGIGSTARCRKSLMVDEFLLPEDSAAAKKAFRELRGALLSGNRSTVIALIDFPLDLVLDGRGVKFGTPHEFENRYEMVFTNYVIDSVRNQDPDKLIGGWDGVSLTNGAVRFRRRETGNFCIENVMPRPVKNPDSVDDFLAKQLTCPPVVLEGRIIAYNWVTHTLPGFENIYIDHFIIDVTNVLAGKLTQHRIRVDFWGVSHLPAYNLPAQVFKTSSVRRMYLRAADDLPANSEVCKKDVQETIAFVDEKTGNEKSRESAITVLTGENSLTYTGLDCFEVHKQFFEKPREESSIP